MMQITFTVEREATGRITCREVFQGGPCEPLPACAWRVSWHVGEDVIAQGEVWLPMGRRDFPRCVLSEECDLRAYALASGNLGDIRRGLNA
jgi:hypothetical protein